MTLRLRGRVLRLSPRKLLGHGGEAEIYRHGRAEVVKIFKPDDHPDYTTAGERRAARARIDEHQHKLPSFPRGLRAEVIAPTDLVTDSSGHIAGYAMPRVRDASLLHRLGDPRERRSGVYGGALVTALLVKVRVLVEALHRAGVVIGDLSDLNGLFRSEAAECEAFLIDTDSYQFGRFPCRVYSERFVDPLVCDPAAPAPILVGKLSESTDWYAFAVLVFRSLLAVGPYGGVFRPGRAGRRVPHAARPLHRISVYADEVVYPKPAIHFSALPDELNHYFASVFTRDHRAAIPERLLADLQWSLCASCGVEHARAACPECRALAPVPKPRVVRGEIVATAISDGEWPAAETPAVWRDGNALCRQGLFGPEAIGSVVGSSCRFWARPEMGAGFYTVGRLLVGFTFDPSSGGLLDGIRLAPLGGHVIAAECCLDEERAWIFLFVEDSAGAIAGRCIVVDAREAELCDHPLDGALDWKTAAAGAAAASGCLFVPSDEGIRRFEIVNRSFRQTRLFADTEPVVDVASVLAVSAAGLFVRRGAPHPGAYRLVVQPPHQRTAS